MFKQAFSLIELMVVIAVIAILAAVATPYYGDYIVRTKLNSGLIILEHLKKKSAEYYSIHGTFPSLADIGAVNTDFATDIVDFGEMGPSGWGGGDSASPYVQIEYTSDVVPQQSAPRLAFIASVNGSSVTWACYTYQTSHLDAADSSISTTFLPQNCTPHP